MGILQCPYCGHEIPVDGEDIGEDGEILEKECPICEKIFVYTACISFIFFERKADCLNGGSHNFKMIHTYPVEFTRWRCTICGTEKNLSESEMEELLNSSEE